MKYCCICMFFSAMAFGFAGCGNRTDAQPPAPMPRPVSVLTLQETDSSRADRQAGTITAWKTEEIGFEVAGRAVFVAETGSDVQGSVLKLDGSLSQQGSQLAALDATRYELNVASIEAQIETAEQQRDAVRIEAESVLPAELKAIEANLKYAQSEMDRTGPLVRSGAITQSDFDRDVANRDAAAARVEEAKAKQKAKEAELASSEANIKELQQVLLEAKRDVADCSLHSPFPGQIADVHVIPGAYLAQGDRVVTVQMTDPISVEVEVSAETARRANYRDSVPIHVSWLGHPDYRINGSIYTIDPVADPQTRTFTVTILIRNQRAKATIPDELQGSPIVRTREIRRIIDRFPEADSGLLFAELACIQHDDQGAFLWKIGNRSIQVSAGQEDLLLQVSKLRVIEGERTIPFLGLATLREIQPVDGQEIKPDTDLFAGELIVPPELEQPWEGTAMLYDHQRWILRPGDIVGVDLTGKDAKRGFYVPMNAISNVSDEYAVVAAEPAADAATAKRIPVQVFDGPGSLKRVESVQPEALQSGMQLIVGGVHYIQDGDSVTVVEEAEVQR